MLEIHIHAVNQNREKIQGVIISELNQVTKDGELSMHNNKKVLEANI